MGKSTYTPSKTPFGFVDGLTLLLIGLKLADIIDWSWWWVLAPIWFMFVVVFIGTLIIALAK